MGDLNIKKGLKKLMNNLFIGNLILILVYYSGYVHKVPIDKGFVILLVEAACIINAFICMIRNGKNG